MSIENTVVTILGLLMGCAAGFVLSIPCAFLYLKYKIDRTLADSGDQLRKSAVGLLQTNISTFIKQYRARKAGGVAEQ